MEETNLTQNEKFKFCQNGRVRILTFVYKYFLILFLFTNKEKSVVLCLQLEFCYWKNEIFFAETQNDVDYRIQNGEPTEKSAKCCNNRWVCKYKVVKVEK